MIKNCLSCGKEIQGDENNPPDGSKVIGIWHGGVVDKVAAGYGSIHDTSIFTIAICDECFTKGLEKGYIAHIKHYM